MSNTFGCLESTSVFFFSNVPLEEGDNFDWSCPLVKFFLSNDYFAFGETEAWI